jgi:hypothetical protein
LIECLAQSTEPCWESMPYLGPSIPTGTRVKHVQAQPDALDTGVPTPVPVDTGVPTLELVYTGSMWG